MVDLISLLRLGIGCAGRAGELLEPAARMGVVLRVKSRHVRSGTARKVQRADVVGALVAAQPGVLSRQRDRARLIASEIIRLEITGSPATQRQRGKSQRLDDIGLPRVVLPHQQRQGGLQLHLDTPARAEPANGEPAEVHRLRRPAGSSRSGTRSSTSPKTGPRGQGVR